MVLVVHSSTEELLPLPLPTGVADWAPAEEVGDAVWVTVTGKLLVCVCAGQSVTVAAQEVTVYTVVDQMVLMTSPGPLGVGELPDEEDAELAPVTPGLEADAVPGEEISVGELPVDEAPLEAGLEPLLTTVVLGEAPVGEVASLGAELVLWTWPEVQVALLQLCVCGLVTREMVLLVEDDVEDTKLVLEVLAIHVVLLQVFVDCGWVTREMLLLLLLLLTTGEVMAVLLSVAELALEKGGTEVEV